MQSTSVQSNPRLPLQYFSNDHYALNFIPAIGDFLVQVKDSHIIEVVESGYYTITSLFESKKKSNATNTHTPLSINLDVLHSDGKTASQRLMPVATENPNIMITKAVLPQGSKLVFSLPLKHASSFQNLKSTFQLDPTTKLLGECILHTLMTLGRYIPYIKPTSNTQQREQTPTTNPPDLVEYPWFYNIIPAEPSDFPPPASGDSLIGEPTFISHPLPPVPTLESIKTDIYQKYLSVSYTLYFYRAIDPFTVTKDDPRVTIFLTDLQNRGVDNYRKKMYMFALTEDKMCFYEEKIDSFLNLVYSTITLQEHVPVLSTFQDLLIPFFLQIHVGYDQFPDEVIEYFKNFILVADGSGIQPEILLKGYEQSPDIDSYFAQRYQAVIQNQDRSTFIFWWAQAGMAESYIVTEAIHNIIAFNQFTHLFYLLILDQYGTGTKVFDQTNHYRFFDLWRATGNDPTQQLDLVREILRILVPNNFSSSLLNDKTSNTINAHIHRLIMSASDPNYSNVQQKELYYDFQTKFEPNLSSCPFSGLSTNPNELFTVSPEDGQTVIPKATPKFQPVYANAPAGKGPVYLPLGFGYRRCAGEIFNYYFLIRLMNHFADLPFTFDTTQKTPIIALAYDANVPDNMYAVVSSAKN